MRLIADQVLNCLSRFAIMGSTHGVVKYRRVHRAPAACIFEFREDSLSASSLSTNLKLHRDSQVMRIGRQRKHSARLTGAHRGETD
jgi:hypothetical protein